MVNNYNSVFYEINDGYMILQTAFGQVKKCKISTDSDVTKSKQVSVADYLNAAINSSIS